MLDLPLKAIRPGGGPCSSHLYRDSERVKKDLAWDPPIYCRELIFCVQFHFLSLPTSFTNITMKIHEFLHFFWLTPSLHCGAGIESRVSHPPGLCSSSLHVPRFSCCEELPLVNLHAFPLLAYLLLYKHPSYEPRRFSFHHTWNKLSFLSEIDSLTALSDLVFLICLFILVSVVY